MTGRRSARTALNLLGRIIRPAAAVIVAVLLTVAALHAMAWAIAYGAVALRASAFRGPLGGSAVQETASPPPPREREVRRHPRDRD